MAKEQRSWTTLLILSIFFWWLGADRFYMGKPGTAILKILTLGGLGWWAIIDWILVLMNKMKDENGNVAKR